MGHHREEINSYPSASPHEEATDHSRSSFSLLQAEQTKWLFSQCGTQNCTQLRWTLSSLQLQSHPDPKTVIASYTHCCLWPMNWPHKYTEGRHSDHTEIPWQITSWSICWLFQWMPMTLQTQQRDSYTVLWSINTISQEREISSLSSTKNFLII